MTKKELLDKLTKYPDDMEVIIWDMMNGNCPLDNVEEITEYPLNGGETMKKVIRLW